MLQYMLRRPLPLPRTLQLLGRAPHTQSAQTLRFFASSTTPAEPKKEKKETVTNKTLWDKVLADHPEQDEQNGDLLYEYSRKKYFGLMSAGSLAHIAFWSWFKGYEQSLVEMHPVLGEPTFFSFVTDDFGSSVGFGMSILLSLLVGFHARRAVGRISVVSGGDKLRFTTHKFFGDLGNSVDVPVAWVSANPNTKNNIILKLGDTRGFYLVDTAGKFYNRAKLERMITFRTDMSEHEEMMKKRKSKDSFEVRTDLPRTDLKAETRQPPKVRYGNLLGKKHGGSRKGKKGKKK